METNSEDYLPFLDMSAWFSSSVGRLYKDIWRKETLVANSTTQPSYKLQHSIRQYFQAWLSECRIQVM